MLRQNKTKTLQANYRLIFLTNKKAEILYKMLYWETKFRGTYQDYTAWPHMGCILEYNLVQYVRNENTVVQSLSLVWLFQPHGLQHIRFPCPSLSPESSHLLRVHIIGDAIQPSHPLLPPSSPAFHLSQHQSLFQ